MSDNRKYITEFTSNNGASWSSLDDDVENIFMEAAGHGPMGYFDVITIEFTDGSTLNYPAHMTSNWQTGATE